MVYNKTIILKDGRECLLKNGTAADGAACLSCAVKAGYKQIELGVVATNDKAISLYQKKGFVEYGRNPKAFVSRHSGYQEMILMRKEL